MIATSSICPWPPPLSVTAVSPSSADRLTDTDAGPLFALGRCLGLEAIATIIAAPFGVAFFAVYENLAIPAIGLAAATFSSLKDAATEKFGRLGHWGKKKSKESIVFLVAFVFGFILLGLAFIAGFLLTVCFAVVMFVGVVGAFATAWAVLLAGLLAGPPVYSLMVIIRQVITIAHPLPSRGQQRCVASPCS